ncbi:MULTISPECIES: hypothetical protein [Lactobacillus]|uniref:hypothetical protein n=1 Tax=Lactobacillus TaxID=1578 RepID=UPI00226A311F|nr:MULTISPECIES: hypothetical protein [Lactobacillus]MCX8720800.1 hypothetical protein [Lactobacillus sp. B4010]MCX8733000.1 hypothetical protein [Lactobacillus sp. B4015]MCX8735562.1 hypothetical protein [Lactobacillus sp. B4012]
MVGTVKNVTELDNGLIAASLQSENLLRAAELMLDKLHSIQQPEDLTLSDYEQLYALTDLMKVYAKNQRDEISHTESLIEFKEE